MFEVYNKVYYSQVISRSTLLYLVFLVGIYCILFNARCRYIQAELVKSYLAVNTAIQLVPFIMDPLQLTHSLVRDFLEKQFGEKVASKVYKSQNDVGEQTSEFSMDLETIVRANFAEGLGRKRKVDGVASAGAKRPKILEVQQSIGHSSSSDTKSSHGKKTVEVTSNALEKGTTSSEDDSSSSSDDFEPAQSKKSSTLGSTSKSRPNVIRNGANSQSKQSVAKEKLNVTTSSSSDDSSSDSETVALKTAQVSSSSETDSSDLEDDTIANVNGTSKTTAHQIAKVSLGKPAGKSVVPAAEESESTDSSMDTAPAVVENIATTPGKGSPSVQPNRLLTSREGNSRNATHSNTLKTSIGLMTPRSCRLSKQDLSKGTVSTAKNMANIKSVAVPAFAEPTQASKKPATSSEEDTSSDDSSSNDMLPFKRSTGGQAVKKKSEQHASVSSDSSSAKEVANDDGKAVFHKQSPVQTASLQKGQAKMLPSSKGKQSATEGQLPKEKITAEKDKQGRRVMAQPSLPSDSSSDDEVATKTAKPKSTAQKSPAPTSKNTSSDESSSEEEVVKKNHSKPSAITAVKEAQNSNSSTSDSSSSEDLPVMQKPPNKSVQKLEASKSKNSKNATVQQTTKQEKKAASSSDSSSVDEELSQEKTPLSKGLAKMESTGVKKAERSTKSVVRQQFSSSSSESSSEEDTVKSRNVLENRSKTQVQAVSEQKAKSSTAQTNKEALDDSSSSSSESVDEATIQVKAQLAKSSYRMDESKGRTTAQTKLAMESSSSTDSSTDVDSTKAKTPLSRSSNVRKKPATNDIKKTVAMDSKQGQNEEVSSSSESSSSDEDSLPNGKRLDTPLHAQLPRQDSRSNDSSANNENALQKKTQSMSNSTKVQTRSTKVNLKNNAPLVSQQMAGEVSSSSSLSSSDEDLSTKRQSVHGKGKQSSCRSVTDSQKSTMEKSGAKCSTPSKTTQQASNKSAVMEETETSDDSSSDDTSTEQQQQMNKTAKATAVLEKTEQKPKLQQSFSRSSSSSTESSSEESKKSARKVKCTDNSDGHWELSTENKKKAKSPPVKQCVSESGIPSKKRKGTETAKTAANVSSLPDVSVSLMDSFAAKKKRKLSSSSSSDSSSSSAEVTKISGAARNKGGAPDGVDSTPVKPKGRNSKSETDNKSNSTKSAEAVKNNGPYRRFTASKEQLDQEFRDNSYQAKKTDTWGKKAYEDLAPVKGKNFRKEKTKKKRGSYKGGKIDPHAIGSIKFPDDDD
uniref:SRP40_C domain-containing protein n=1 Tax=Trichuris muris TaxID=70415 RepID=A0A5S6R061_TRIMR